MYTISTHNGANVALEHNTRNRKYTDAQKHIDPKGQFEIWHSEKLPDAYSRIFGDALNEYNERQTRKDRRIRSYLAKVERSAKKKPVYELIITIGSMDNLPPENTAREIMRDFVEGWRQANPNLEMVAACYHADEKGAPHVHIDYIPIGRGFRRGLSVQNSLTKALEGQGFRTKGRNTAQIQWEHKENDRLREICLEHGLAIEPTKKKRREHLHTEEYKDRKKLREREKKLAKIEEGIDRKIQQIETLRDKMQRASRELALVEEERDQLRYDLHTLERNAEAFLKLRDFCRGVCINGRSVWKLYKDADRKHNLPTLEI